MRLSEETIKHFADRGVSVRWYAEETYEKFRKRVWQEMYDYSFNYSKGSCRELNPTEKDWCISYETLAEYEEHCREFADRTTDRHCGPYEYDKLFIEYDGKTIVKKESVKSKEITVEYIDKLIAKNEKAYSGYYGQFAIAMQRLLEANGIHDRFCVYPTTYGIGVWVFYNSSVEDDIEKVTKILDDRGVEYYNEYSDAHWVYRYRVSKKVENIAKIVD